MIIAASLWYAFGMTQSAYAHTIYDDVVVHTLLPLFSYLIGTVLTWIFGKPLVEALAERLRSPR